MLGCGSRSRAYQGCAHRKKKFRWKKTIYRERNQVERFFNKLKQFRRIATRYDKLGATFFAFIKLAAVRIAAIN